MKYSKSFEVRFTETDRTATATPIALFDYLQDTAVAHGDAVGLTPRAIADKGFGWMLNRVRLRFDRYPKRGETVTVTTWGSNLHGLFAVREWELRDAAETVLVAASSRWVFFDIAKKKVVRLPEFLAEMYGEHPERALDEPFERAKPAACDAFERRFHVRASDLDTNQHANSACYLDWALEAVPEPLLHEGKPADVELTFKKESVLGDGLIVRSAQDESPAEQPAFHHVITRESNGDVLAYGSSVWRTGASAES